VENFPVESANATENRLSVLVKKRGLISKGNKKLSVAIAICFLIL
jgi:cell division protein FtsL